MKFQLATNNFEWVKTSYLPVPAFGPIRRKPRIHFVESQIHDGGPTRDDAAVGVDERVGQDGDRLHPKLQSLVEVAAVEHTAVDVAVNRK